MYGINIKDSQNFLHSTGLVEELAGMTSITKSDTVVEVGPGKGIITEALSKRCKKVIAVELDTELAKNLREKFAGTNVEIIEKDFMTLKLPQNEFKMFSNIPFNMTADILTKCLMAENGASDIWFIMQYEAFLKFAGEPFCQDSYKSLLFKPRYEAKLIYNFKPTDFYPVPGVSIVFAHFHKREFCDIKRATMQDWYDFLSFVFLEKGQNFKTKTKNIFSYEQQKRITKESKLDGDSTISEWTYSQWLKMFNVYNQFVTGDKKRQVANAYNKMTAEQSKLTKFHRDRNQMI